MTLALCSLGLNRWDVMHGYCVAYKIKWKRLDPHEFASLVFWYWTRNLNEEQFDAFVREIEKPPPGVNPTKGSWSDEALLEQFQQAMLALG